MMCAVAVPAMVLGSYEILKAAGMARVNGRDYTYDLDRLVDCEKVCGIDRDIRSVPNTAN